MQIPRQAPAYDVGHVGGRLPGQQRNEADRPIAAVCVYRSRQNDKEEQTRRFLKRGDRQCDEWSCGLCEEAHVCGQLGGYGIVNNAAIPQRGALGDAAVRECFWGKSCLGMLVASILGGH
ncbi:hypothetical protein [Stieleria maiorica]|uniref:hypothetical protein n=1 Tax=Stieleria maiorica TaxID=2795974 RepID=UPI0011CA3E06|nr:hypothetical protein [Stieleria maiorica]